MSRKLEDLPAFDFAARRRALLDQIGEGIAVFRAPPLAVHANDARVRAEPFDAIELDLSILWADVVLGPR